MKIKTIITGIILSLLLILPASASDYTLGIFGNANEDDTINMQDVTYTELIILEYKDETQLADAKYDGEVDILDVTQIELIILGREKELTVLDSAERTVTLEMPVERVVVARMGPHEPMIILAKDKIVGLTEGIRQYRKDILEKTGLMDIPSVGYVHGGGLDYEKILSLDPDLVLVTVHWVDEISSKLPEDYPVVALDFDGPGAEKMIQEFQILGMLVGEEEKASDVCSWIMKYDGIIEDRIEGMSLEEMPTFYIETYADFITYGSNAYDGKTAAGCGGCNIIDGVDIPAGSYGEYEISPEWLLDQNPDVIFRRVYYAGFDWTAEDGREKLNELIDRPGWDELSAVREGRVYLYDDRICLSPRYIVGRCYFAMWLQPDIFEDLDPESIHTEYWSEFLDIDLEGVWTYPL